MQKRKRILLPRASLIKELAEKTNIHTFVETGTHLGHMVCAVKQVFSNIYTIELSESLYKKAVARFIKDKNVHPIFGDSGEILPLILPVITHPCLYWLDAHFSGGDTTQSGLRTPINAEIDAILTYGNEKDVVIIDNIECFKGESREAPDYPTIASIEAKLKTKFPMWTICVENQILRAYNGKSR